MAQITSPFKFLDAYTREDREIFFGRDREIEELYQKVFESKILLVYGISGTGKTSLISCGLANKFEESDWLPISVRKGKDINASLADEINKAAVSPLKEGASFQKMIQSVYLDHFKPVYLIFDQFEELFIFGDRQERDEFIHTISELVKSDIQCKFLFSIREEYLAGVTEFESYIPDFLSNRMRVEKMTRQQAMDVIEGPCGVNGISVEKGFSESLLNKLNPESTEIELTYLQVFLDKIFKISGNSNEFVLKQLEQVGDVSDLLGSFLEEQIGELEDPDTGLVVLKAFVSMQGTKKQIGEEEIGDFAQTLGKPIEHSALTDLLQRFVNLRVLKDKDEHDQYELRHDSLAIKIYEKITLVEKELLEIKDFLDNAYSNHERRGVYLNEADLKYIAPYEDKLFLSNKQQQFISDSKNEIAKSQRRRRRLVAAAAILLITILTIFTGWAMRERGKAFDQSKIAEEQKSEAITSRDLAIQAQEAADRARNESEQSREEAEVAKNDALAQKQLADSALVIAEYQRGLSEEQRQRAEGLFEEANEQRQIALTAQQAAEESAEEVKETSRNAMFQLYLFNAKEFANESFLMEKDDSLKALLALNAYDLVNYAYENYAVDTDTIEYDVEIREALSQAYRKFESDILLNGSVGEIISSEDLFLLSNHLGQSVIGKLEESRSGQFPDLQIITSIPGSSDHFIKSIGVDYSGSRIVYGTSDGEVRLVNSVDSTTSVVETLYLHEKGIISTIIIPEDELLVTAANDKTIRIWNLQESAFDLELQISETLHDIVYVGNGYVVYTSGEGNLYGFSINETDAEPTLIRKGLNRIHKLAYNHYYKWLVTSSYGELLVHFLSDTFSIARTIEMPQSHKGIVSSIVFSPDNQWLGSASHDGEILLWDLHRAMKEGFAYTIPSREYYKNQRIFSLTFDETSKYLLFADYSNLRISIISVDLAYNKLKAIIGNKSMSDRDWKYYIKGDIELH